MAGNVVVGVVVVVLLFLQLLNSNAIEMNKAGKSTLPK